MQVINVRTNELVYFPERPDHPYAILSHTWEEGEVSLQAFKERKNLSLPGHQKIAKACHLASLEGYDYIWIDTCCIDKTSSAELSEAINSMFKWYQQAQVCYAYLSDYEHGIPVPWQKGLRGCRWFTRGWTLQELVAPAEVVFLDCQWQEIGTRTTLSAELSSITGIDQSLLQQKIKYNQFSVAQRMSWAASRETTKKEDKAYSLMGIFDVNMPLLYGEGSNAFQRLQLEILKTRYDQSIFSWCWLHGGSINHAATGLLATSTRDFQACGNVRIMQSPTFNGCPARDVFRLPYAVNGMHLRMEAPTVKVPSEALEDLQNRSWCHDHNDQPPTEELFHDLDSFEEGYHITYNLQDLKDCFLVVLEDCRKDDSYIGILVLQAWSGALYRIHNPSLIRLRRSWTQFKELVRRENWFSLSGIMVVNLQEPSAKGAYVGRDFSIGIYQLPSDVWYKLSITIKNSEIEFLSPIKKSHFQGYYFNRDGAAPPFLLVINLKTEEEEGCLSGMCAHIGFEEGPFQFLDEERENFDSGDYGSLISNPEESSFTISSGPILSQLKSTSAFLTASHSVSNCWEFQLGDGSRLLAKYRRGLQPAHEIRLRLVHRPSSSSQNVSSFVDNTDGYLPSPRFKWLLDLVSENGSKRLGLLEPTVGKSDDNGHPLLARAIKWMGGNLTSLQQQYSEIARRYEQLRGEVNRPTDQLKQDMGGRRESSGIGKP